MLTEIEDSFCLVPISIVCLFTIYLKFVLCHPVFDVQITVRGGFQKSVDVFREGAVK